MADKDNQSTPKGNHGISDNNADEWTPRIYTDTEDDNLYTLPDDETGDNDDEEEIDEDNENKDQDEDEPEESETGSAASAGGFLFGLKLLVKVMTAPVEGWKSLKREKIGPENLASSIFYPMIALAAVTEFAPVIYGVQPEVSKMLMEALGDFIAFFFGYFSVLAFCGILFTKNTSDALKSDFGKEFIMMNMTTLALFRALFNLFPMADAVLVFLPLWTLYLICKGVRFLRIEKERETKVQVLLCFMLLGFPCLWYWLCSLLLPGF